LISRANAEEKLSFVQTAASGTTMSGYVNTEVDFNFQPGIMVDSGSVASNPNSAGPILRGDINLTSGVSYQGTLMDLNDSASLHSIHVESLPVVPTTLNIQTVPEPSSFALSGLAYALIAASRLRKQGFRSC